MTGKEQQAAQMHRYDYSLMAFESYITEDQDLNIY